MLTRRLHRMEAPPGGASGTSRATRRHVPILAVLDLLAAGQAVAQTTDRLPPVAEPPLPPGLGAPPPEGFRPYPPPEGFPALPPGPGAPELSQADERRRALWRAAVEEEFRETWGRRGCLPHPQRHGAWFYEFADRLGAATEEQQRLLHDGLVMERVAAYEPPLPQPERVLRDGQRWLDGLLGPMSRPAAPDYFCR
jgi:hypothetical protein